MSCELGLRGWKVRVTWPRLASPLEILCPSAGRSKLEHQTRVAGSRAKGDLLERGDSLLHGFAYSAMDSAKGLVGTCANWRRFGCSCGVVVNTPRDLLVSAQSVERRRRYDILRGVQNVGSWQLDHCESSKWSLPFALECEKVFAPRRTN